jgi:hypothetical protein
MVQLLVHSGAVAADAPVARTGGVPLVPPDFVWPTCETCEGAQQFLAHLPLDGDVAVSVFMCQNDPGLCEEWDVSGDGNRALVVSGPLAPAAVPAEGVTLLEEVSGARTVEVDRTAYDEARSAWAEGHGVSPREVLGSLGGDPSWVQGDETPECEGCDGPMPFVAHLEEGRDHATAMNFGGGLAYVFACPTHRTGAFLWQC